MFKYLLIINVLIVVVVTQDMPPPELDISTITPLTTTGPTTLQPTEFTTTEPATTTTEVIETTAEVETSTTSAITTTTTATNTTTTEGAATTTEATTTTTPATTTNTTRRNDVPISPATDSPYWPTKPTNLAPSYPFKPNSPNFLGLGCYFKRQYGYPELRWTCQGFRYVYPLECFKCCYLQYSSLAGCYRVHDHHCNSANHQHHGFYK